MKLSRKWKQVIALSFALNILLIGSLSYVLAQSGGTFTIGSGVYPLADYTVWREDSSYYAKDRLGAQPSFSGSTNASYVINNALAGLESGRTYKQKAVLTGSFTLTAQIQIPSYTVLEIVGSLTLANNVDAHMIVNDNSNGNAQIEIVGGSLDGNHANQGSDHKGIELTNVTDAVVNGVSVIQFGTTGIDLIQCSNFQITNNFLNYTGGIGARTYSYDGIIRHNKVYNTEVQSGGNAHGINVASGSGLSHDIIIDGNIVNSTTGQGITTDYGGYKFTIVNNFVFNTTWNGIEVDQQASVFPYLVTVSNNRVENASLDGIMVEAYDSVISDNIVRYSTQSGIALQLSLSLTVSGNVATYNGYFGISLASVNDSAINDNTVKFNDRAGVQILRSLNLTVSGNSIISNGQGGTWDALLIKDEGSTPYCADITIVANVISGASQRYGVRSEESTNWVLLVANDLRGNGTDEFSLVGANNKVAHNLGDATHDA